MAKPVATDLETLLIQQRRQIADLSRRTRGGTGSQIFPVNAAQQAALVESYRPSPQRPLFVIRTDLGGTPRIMFTTDGVLWNVIDWSRYPAAWQALSYQNGWQSYHGNDPNYPVAGYTRTSSGIVVMKGLIRSGTVGTTAFTLPSGYRPDANLLFLSASANARGVNRVYPDGQFTVTIGSNTWSALDSVAYPAADPNRVWTPLTVGAGWTDFRQFDGGFPAVSYWQDEHGRVWLRGMVRRTGAAPAGGAPIVSGLPVTSQNRMLVTTDAGTASVGFANNGTLGWYGGSTGTAWLALPQTGPIVPAGVGAWIDLPYVSPWATLGGWTSAAMCVFPDGLVVARGMVTGGASGAAIANVPAKYRADGYNHIAPANMTDAFGRMNVTTGHTLTPTNGTLTWVSLSDINYLSEG